MDSHHEHQHSNLSKYEEALSKYNLHIHDEEVKRIVDKIIEDNAEANRTSNVKRLILSCTDLTSLKVTDNEESILKLAEKINKYSDEYEDFPTPASVCVYPKFASILHDSLESEGIAIDCVSGGFPSSQTFPEIKEAETALAIQDGANEIDIVMNIGSFLASDFESLTDEIIEQKAICGENKLKVILETGILQTATNIKKAAILALYSGADFIKTSTGKIEPGASYEAVYTMCEAIKEYYTITGNKAGIKVAGGLKTVDELINYLTIVESVLGREWITPNYFRVGTSRLANELVNQIVKETINPF